MILPEHTTDEGSEEDSKEEDNVSRETAQIEPPAVRV